jgi:hypothetical protein
LQALALAVGDPAAVWSALGFAVAVAAAGDGDGGDCWVGGLRFALGAEGRGVRAWSLQPVDGLRSFDPAVADEVAAVLEHPNGVVALDHVVVTTPDHDRTLAALADAGLELRRVRETDTYGAPMRQGFYRVGPTILEVVGPALPSGDGPARFWGLAFSADLDAAASYLGDRLHPAKEAVQEDRRIATLDKAAGSTVAIAFMSPR